MNSKETLLLDTSVFFQKMKNLSHPAMRVANYLLTKINCDDNVCYLTCQMIADDLKLSKATMVRVMKSLRNVDFVKRVRNGAWMMNPEVAFHGLPIDRDSYPKNIKIQEALIDKYLVAE